MEAVEKLLIDSLRLKPEISKTIFNYPTESRFKNYFRGIKTKVRKRKTMIVYPKNIMLDLDKRTSIIIKNIPDDVSCEQFRNIVLNFCKYIDFFYVPLSIKTRKKLRVAFVNVLNYKYIVPLYMGLIYKIKFVYKNPNIVMEICYSKVQGRFHLIKRFFHEFQQSQFISNNNINNLNIININHNSSINTNTTINNNIINSNNTFNNCNNLFEKLDNGEFG